MNGNRIKLARLNKGLTLVQLAERTGYTPSFISLIERNLRQPSLAALRRLSEALECSVVWLVMEDKPGFKVRSAGRKSSRDGTLIRKADRRIVTMPEIDVQYEIITPSPGENHPHPRMTGMCLKLKPSQWVTEEAIVHQGSDESIFLVQGRLKATVGGKTFALEVGDSLYIPEGTLHNYTNTGDEDATVIVYFSSYVL